MTTLNRILTISLFLLLASCGGEEVKPDEKGIKPIKLEYKNQQQSPQQDNSDSSQDNPDPDRFLKAAEINAELGIAYLRRGDIEKADMKLAKAYAQNPESTQVNLGLGLLNERLNYKEKAEEFFREAVKLEGREKAASAHNNYARFLCGLARYDEADQFFQVAFRNKLYQNREVSYTNAGYCAFLAKNYDQAIEYYRTALTNNRTYYPALLNMTKLFAIQKQYPLAKAYIDRYFVVGPVTPDVLVLAYEIEQALGNDSEAATFFNRLKNDFPDSKQTHQAYMLESEIKQNNKTTDNKK